MYVEKMVDKKLFAELWQDTPHCFRVVVDGVFRASFVAKSLEEAKYIFNNRLY